MAVNSKQFIDDIVFADALADGSSYSIIGEADREITLSFLTRDVDGRRPEDIRGFVNRFRRPSEYFGWKSDADTPIDLRYSQSDNLKQIITTALSKATDEVSRVSAVKFKFTEDNDNLASINYQINENFIPTSFGARVAAQALVDENFVNPEDNFSILSFNNTLIDYEDIGYLNWLTLHELLHSFGFRDVSGGAVDSQNVTVLSYNEIGFDLIAPARQTLSIADIYALQQVVGANTEENAEDGSVYKLSDLTYTTIWDAGGDDDVIDASNLGGGNIIVDGLFDEGVTIDLRQGTTSGFEVDGYEVGIAFGAVIENALGSGDNDIIIGNAASNDIKGNDGDDFLFSDGKAVDQFKNDPFNFVPGSYAVNNRFNDIFKIDSSAEDVTAIDGVAGPDSSVPDIVDGGDGDDFIFIGAGPKGIAVGGAGNDIIYNASRGGELWGDDRGAGQGQVNGKVNGDADIFLWSPGTVIKDAGKNDALFAGGSLVTGGTTISWWGGSQEKGVARDFLNPWITYGRTDSGQLLIGYSQNRSLDPSQTNNEILGFTQVVENWENDDLGIRFVTINEDDTISNLAGLFAIVGAAAAAYIRAAKTFLWEPIEDPLVLDLNGDGFVTDGLGAAFFDQNGDGFAESSGWISGEDGFLAHDADGSGTIDDISELFGAPGVSGFTELAAWDSNFDGLINAEDARFDELLVWRDFNEDAITQTGELWSLDDLGITALSLTPQGPRDVQIPDGTVIRAESFFTRTDGSTGALGGLAIAQNRYRIDVISKYIPSNFCFFVALLRSPANDNEGIQILGEMA